MPVYCVCLSIICELGGARVGSVAPPPPFLRLCVISRQQNNAKQWQVRKQETTDRPSDDMSTMVSRSEEAITVM